MFILRLLFCLAGTALCGWFFAITLQLLATGLPVVTPALMVFSIMVTAVAVLLTFCVAVRGRLQPRSGNTFLA